VEKEIEKMVAKWFTLRNISVSVMLSFKNVMLKRSFDLIMGALGLIFLWWIILLGWVCAYFDTGAGVFLFSNGSVVTVGCSVLSNYEQCDRIIL
jgi:lipopolysaccharide/colanic/teichoic acid biosynthesis glycosyltransferase